MLGKTTGRCSCARLAEIRIGCDDPCARHHGNRIAMQGSKHRLGRSPISSHSACTSCATCCGAYQSWRYPCRQPADRAQVRSRILLCSHRNNTTRKHRALVFRTKKRLQQRHKTAMKFRPRPRPAAKRRRCGSGLEPRRVHGSTMHTG